MQRFLLLICFILVFTSGCLNSNETKSLERRVKELETYLEKYQQRTEECMELLRKASKISELCFPITERLDRLDSTVYGNQYIVTVHQDNVKPEDIINGYLNLIEQVERELQNKSKP